MPIMPDEAKNILVERYGLKEDAAEFITQTPKIYEYYLSAAGAGCAAQAANLLIGEVLTVCGEDPSDYVSAEQLASAAKLFGEGTVTSNVAKELVSLAAKTGKDPRVIAEEKNLCVIREEEVLRGLLQAALTACPKALEDYKKGKVTAKKTFLGHVMRETKGRADAVLCDRILDEILVGLGSDI